MRIKYKVWILATAIISIIVIADIYVGYSHIESSIQEELNRDAEDMRAMIMSTRRIFQKQFIESGLPINRGFKFKVQHPVLGYWRLLKKLHRVS